MPAPRSLPGSHRLNKQPSSHVRGPISLVKLLLTILISFAPADIISLTTGNHQIYLESNTNMITWTATQPGVFNSSNALCFFRVRIKK